MKNGFIKAAAAAPELRVGDTVYNTETMKKYIQEADGKGVNLLVFPELGITAYTCADLFLNDTLISSSLGCLEELMKFTAGRYPVVMAGLPLRVAGKLYNCAAVIHNGSLLGIVPKTYIPDYGEFYEKRQFSSATDYAGPEVINIFGRDVPFGNDIIFPCIGFEDYAIGVELCEDLWVPVSPATDLCLAGATVIANLSASDELIGKAEYRRLLVSSASSRLLCGYIYASSGAGESSQDLVFSGHRMIYEYGSCLAEAAPFSESGLTVSEIDVFRLRHERAYNSSFIAKPAKPVRRVYFSQQIQETSLTRSYPQHPFVPADGRVLSERAEEILRIQSTGLMKRIGHINCRTAVIGISGGLDSTLALLVAARAMKLLGRPASDIVAVTMPCFGTTARTKSNAQKLCELMGVSFREVDITKSVLQHFEDIGHDPFVTDVTYENCQARERTQVLMDISNETGGIVIGTGDLSELALGWATYNGDHMSMYGVNCSVPKTLVRYIIAYEAANCSAEMKAVLDDILATPVSPELLPAGSDGEIAQKTEDLVGPYELHDFFLYHMLRTGAGPKKIYYLACRTFDGVYDKGTILKWLKVFTRRFFSNQFKRSCLPDGPKVGTVTLSPRGDLRMPSDACSGIWLAELDEC